MVSDPMICIQGKKQGTIEWFTNMQKQLKHGFIYDNYTGPAQNVWQPYADFERGKLDHFTGSPSLNLSFNSHDAYSFYSKNKLYSSKALIGYDSKSYASDSESSRLLKRAEFLKAVCEKENVPWIEDKKNNEMVEFCSADSEPKLKYGTCRPSQFKGDECGIPFNQEELYKDHPYTKEEELWSKGDTELKEGLAHLYIHMVMAQAKEEEREWRKALLDFLNTALLPDEDYQGLSEMFEDLCTKFL